MYSTLSIKFSFNYIFSECERIACSQLLRKSLKENLMDLGKLYTFHNGIFIVFRPVALYFFLEGLTYKNAQVLYERYS